MATDYYNPDGAGVGKKKYSRLRFYLWFGAILIFTGLILSLAYLVFKSSFFEVKNFEIIGARAVERQALIDAAAKELIAKWPSRGFFGPDSVLFWAIGNKPAMLKSLPVFNSFSVKTDIWKKEVKISVTERSLFGIWCVAAVSKDASSTEAAEDCYGFDEEGITFSRVPETEGSIILKIKDQNPEAVILGEHLLGAAETANNILETIKIFKTGNFRVKLFEVRDINLREWRARLVGGPDLYFSLDFVPENLEVVLENLKKKLNINGLEYLDFRVQNRIYYK